MARTRDMTVGSPAGHIVRFCLPIVAGNLLQQVYSLVDTVVIGRVEGVTAQAAVSSAGWLDWMVLSIAMGLAQGFAIEIAQRFGANDLPALSRAEGQSVLLSVLSTALLLAVSQLFLTPVLRLMNTPPDTFALTTLYLRIIFSGLPLVMGYNLLGGFLRSVGDSRTPMLAMVSASIVNMVLDVLFVAFLHWSVAGVAIATTIAQGVSFLICLSAVRRLPVMRLRSGDLKFDTPVMRRLMHLATPIALQNAVISVGGLVLQGVVNSFGFIFMAGYSAASKLQGLLELAGSSVGAAVGTFAGQNLGAGRLDRVKDGLRKSVALVLVLSVLVAGLMIGFGKPLLSLFMEDDPAIVSQVLTIGYRFLVVMSAGLWTLYILFVYRSTLQGLGDTVIPMVSGLVELGMRIGSALLLPRLMGEWGVYIAEITAWAGAAALLVWGYYRRMRGLDAQTQP